MYGQQMGTYDIDCSSWHNEVNDTCC